MELSLEFPRGRVLETEIHAGVARWLACDASKVCHCTFCRRLISFCARFSSDSDQSSRALAPEFFSTLEVNSTSFWTLARNLASAALVNATCSWTNAESRPKSIWI